MTADPVTHAERIAAARARVVADRKRGAVTDPFVVALAEEETCAGDQPCEQCSATYCPQLRKADA